MSEGEKQGNVPGGTDKAAEAERTSERPCVRYRIERNSAAFPPLLEVIPQPPDRLFVRGCPDVLLKPAMGIVGARKATPYGLMCAERFARLAVECGLVVVSGGAIGCDQAAHRGALEAGGQTVVVLGCGADVVYPKRARDLFGKIVDEGGALVSEYGWDMEPKPWAFRRRNRLIAGLGNWLLVVEAGLPSGTFGTADDALSQGKDVLVVPGSILSPESAGSNRLLSQGAVPIVDDDTFLDAIGVSTLMIPAAPVARRDDGSDDPMAMLVSALRANPMTVDEMSRSFGLDVRDLSRMIALGESKGVFVRYRDGRYGSGRA